MNDHREACPVCGGQPKYSFLFERWECLHGDPSLAKSGVLLGPYPDVKGTGWDAQMRTIRARVLADVRTQIADLVPMTMSEARALGKPESEAATEEVCAAVERCVQRVLALLDNKEIEK